MEAHRGLARRLLLEFRGTNVVKEINIMTSSSLRPYELSQGRGDWIAKDVIRPDDSVLQPPCSICTKTAYSTDAMDWLSEIFRRWKKPQTL